MIRELKTAKQLREAFPVLKELRPHLDLAGFSKIYRAARTADRYALFGLFVGADCAALLGYRVLTDCTHGRHLYIDELVTTAAHRGKGLGARFLKFAEAVRLRSTTPWASRTRRSHSTSARSSSGFEEWTWRTPC